MTPNDERDGERDPNRGRPQTEASYGIPDSADGALPWAFVAERMRDARNYWVTTIRPDGSPHVRPTWGVWVDGTFHCGGGEGTRWVRNLARNPEIVVHGESATEVVILEGQAERINHETASSELIDELDAAYETKYDTPHGTPFFAVRPTVVFAWSDFPTDATRWEFDE
ncbi:pyridoxamine 5'-phosphate oxidase family protein [Natrinema zhouii]|uniref:Pyridoxamine 5'-phosphate oxidase family protein n=1 Tax=Natrinema zhouii TaxID=1710539 RepID=A0A7D6GU28_9EURY|nr:pyridoxamine 5'-phosphate oxidase family protein [Natrinema zhouii]QLK24826.1 pyridoxamine 5'-phosphate oxidase family protein [Natrinema zhouii]